MQRGDNHRGYSFYCICCRHARPRHLFPFKTQNNRLAEDLLNCTWQGEAMRLQQRNLVIWRQAEAHRFTH